MRVAKQQASKLPFPFLWYKVMGFVERASPSSVAKQGLLKINNGKVEKSRGRVSSSRFPNAVRPEYAYYAMPLWRSAGQHHT